ncbi:hypothetical protein GIB67_040474 [Kingdonia uniflora]|uniref:Pectin acetylesterase n=1 Tax=Kingdonia uniflora TaxID=39325 RepID=A0A7J7L569_9MAGN|nr:hypothetical protein GIB67_040474 [Kingdonia uniflora]
MANLRLIELIWRSKWGRRDYTIAAIGFTMISFALIVSFDSSSSSRIKESESNSLIRINDDDDDLVDLTLLKNAQQKGAVCLDGSSPGYHFQRGFDSGSHNWLLHIEGGGWCNTIESCSARKLTALGSSNYMDRQVRFTGILSRKASENPDFFNWNKVKIRYCDGASLAGNPANELKVASTDSPKLFFRGQLIWEAIMDEFVALGLANAKQALLSGCSAGGLATLIHCDSFKEILPKESKVKCLSDAGFFLDEKDISGNNTMRSFYRDVVYLQVSFRLSSLMVLSKVCARIVSLGWNRLRQCVFPHEIIKNIKTPVFFVNSAYDFWQIQNVLAPHVSDYHNIWHKCRLNLKDCDSNQTQILHGKVSYSFESQGFNYKKHVPAKSPVKNIDRFAFCDFCHKTLAEAVADWYFDRRIVKEIDCAYPCNPTCHNMDFS